jgi:hypothetical protein
MRLIDRSGSRREDEGAVAFVFRRTLEISLEGLLGLAIMAAVIGVLALVLAVMELLARVLPGPAGT